MNICARYHSLYVKETCRLGAIPLLVELLRDDTNPRQQYEAAWALTNIAGGDSKNAEAIMESGAVTSLIDGMRNPHADIQEQCAWALGNLAGDGAEVRDRVLEDGALPPLLGILEESDASYNTLQTASWALSNLSKYSPGIRLEHVPRIAATLAGLCRRRHLDAEMLKNVAFSSMYLFRDEGKIMQIHRIDAVIEAGLHQALMGSMRALFDHSGAAATGPASRGSGASRGAGPPRKVITPMQMFVSELLCGTDEQTEAALQHGAIGLLMKCMGYPHVSLRYESMWALSNVAAGTPEQVRQLVEEGALQAAIEIVRDKDEEPMMHMEAMFVVANYLATMPVESYREAFQLGAFSCLSDGIAEGVLVGHGASVAAHGVLKAAVKVRAAYHVYPKPDREHLVSSLE